MGPATVGAESKAELAGVQFRTGLSVDVGNPHLVCLMDSVDAPGRPRSERRAQLRPGGLPVGVNIEFVVPLAPDRVRMRVYERGVGETRSCGTGTVAAAAAFRATTGSARDKQWPVEVPGGCVQVSFGPDGRHS